MVILALKQVQFQEAVDQLATVQQTLVMSAMEVGTATETTEEVAEQAGTVTGNMYTVPSLSVVPMENVFVAEAEHIHLLLFEEHLTMTAMRLLVQTIEMGEVLAVAVAQVITLTKVMAEVAVAILAEVVLLGMLAVVRLAAVQHMFLEDLLLQPQEVIQVLDL